VKTQKILSEEWRYLIILDACRFDYFEKYNFVKGKLEKRFSLASCTDYWLKENFKGKHFDIIYISANGFVGMKDYLNKGFDGSKHFFWVDEVWKYEPFEGFKFLLPESLNKAVFRNLKRYPTKRFIIHYDQPHGPFIGKPTILPPEPQGQGKEDLWIYDQVKSGEIPLSLLRRAYLGNLIKVLRDGVCVILPDLLNKGRVVITSDHGELLGEYGKFGHPADVDVPELRVVPWLVIE